MITKRENSNCCFNIKQTSRTQLRKAMTFPEVIIVFLIIAIIAAISAPKYSEAKRNSELEELVNGLETVRQQIELYKVHHDGLYPGQKYKGQKITEKEFVKALTTSDGFYGPYLIKMPKNPFNGLRSVRIGTTTLSSAAGDGWFFNSKTGDFRADDLKFHRAY